MTPTGRHEEQRGRQGGVLSRLESLSDVRSSKIFSARREGKKRKKHGGGLFHSDAMMFHHLVWRERKEEKWGKRQLENNREKTQKRIERKK